jgi:hypothetical protein
MPFYLKPNLSQIYSKNIFPKKSATNTGHARPARMLMRRAQLSEAKTMANWSLRRARQVLRLAQPAVAANVVSDFSRLRF